VGLNYGSLGIPSPERSECIFPVISDTDQYLGLLQVL